MTQVNTPTDGDAFDRVPPNSVEAETCVLGSMILHSPCIDAVVQIVQAEDFYRPVHQLLFTCLSELLDAGKPIDLVTVREDLQRREQLEQIGGIEYVVALVEGVPSAANAEYYAKIVRDKALLRELIRAGNEIAHEAYQTHDDAADFLDSAERRIFNVSARHIVGETVSLGSVLKQTFEKLQEQEGRLITGMASGYGQLDEMTSGFQDSEMIILAARPSMGKTSLLLNIAEHMAVVEKIPVAVFSLEMSKEQLTQRMLASHARFDLKKMRRGMIQPEDWSLLQMAAGDLEPAPLFADDSASLTIMQLRAKARRLYSSHGVRCILVDYLQLMSYSGRANSRQEQISEISRGMKALARDLSIPIVVAAQLNRGPADRPSHRPRMSDLRESGSIEQDADVVMLLHNEDYYHKGEEGYMPKNTTELIIEKQRNGPTGVIYLQFLPGYTRFESAAPSHTAAQAQRY